MPNGQPDLSSVLSDVDPSILAAIAGAAGGGLAGAITPGEDRLRRSLLYAALLGPLAGGAHYAYRQWPGWFPDPTEKDRDLTAGPSASDMLQKARMLRFSGYGGLGLAGGLAGATTAAGLQQLGGFRRAPVEGLKTRMFKLGPKARLRGLLRRKGPMGTAGAAGGLTLAALIDWLSRD